MTTCIEGCPDCTATTVRQEPASLDQCGCDQRLDAIAYHFEPCPKEMTLIQQPGETVVVPKAGKVVAT